MDIVKFFDDLTSGHLLAWKTAVSTLIVAMAGLQVALGARLWGAGGLPMSTAVASRVHRWNGRLLLVLSMLIAFACLMTQAGPISPARILIHSIVGSTLLALLCVKLSLVRVTARGRHRLPAVGIALFVNYVAIWITSVYDFATSSTNDPLPSTGLKAWVVVTGIVAGLLGGLGIVALLRRRPAAAV